MGVVAPFNLATPGTAGGAGGLVLTLPSVPNGLALRGTICVTTSNAAAQWTLTVSGIIVGQWQGNSTAGPFRIQGPCQPKLIGTAVTPNLAVVAAWAGTQGTAQTIPGAVPAPLPSSTQTTISGPVTVGTITGPVTVTGTVTANLAAGSTVNIGNTPTVKIAAGSASINIGTVTSVTSIVNVTHANVANVAGTILAVGDKLTVLGTQRFTGPAAGAHSFTVTTGTLTYGAVLVVVNVAGGVYTGLGCIAVSHAATKPTWAAPLRKQATVAGAIGAVAIVPCAITGSTVQITLYVATAIAGTVKVTVYGLTSNPGVSLGADARVRPVGAFGATVASGVVGTHVLIAAPTTPLRVVIKTLALYGGGTSSGLALASIRANINGTVVPLLGAVGGTGIAASASLVDDAGIETNPATAVNLTVTTISAQGFVAAATYDLVA